MNATKFGVETKMLQWEIFVRLNIPLPRKLAVDVNGELNVFGPTLQRHLTLHLHYSDQM